MSICHKSPLKSFLQHSLPNFRDRDLRLKCYQGRLCLLAGQGVPCPMSLLSQFFLFSPCSAGSKKETLFSESCIAFPHVIMFGSGSRKGIYEVDGSACCKCRKWPTKFGTGSSSRMKLFIHPRANLSLSLTPSPPSTPPDQAPYLSTPPTPANPPNTALPLPPS